MNPEKVGNFRPVPEGKGVLFTTFVLTQDGEFKARVRGFGNQVGKEPVKFALLVNGKEQKIFDVKGKDGKETQNYEVKLELKKGVNRVGARVSQRIQGPRHQGRKEGQTCPGPSNGFQLEGPLDTRPASHRKIMAHKEGLDKREAAREISDTLRFASLPPPRDEGGSRTLAQIRRSGREEQGQLGSRHSARACKRSSARRNSCSASNSTIAPTARTPIRSTIISWRRGSRTSSGARCRTTSFSPSPRRSSCITNLEAAGQAHAQGSKSVRPGREFRDAMAATAHA